MSEVIETLAVTDLLVPNLPSVAVKMDLAIESKPYFKDCQIEAAHDIEAVTCWLKKYADNLNTFSTYQRQAKLFLMWCSYERGKTIGQLKAQDFEAYFDFLRHPPQVWCADRATLRQGRQSNTWRPLVGGLSGSAIKLSFQVLQSLMNYLANSHYVYSDPLKLIKVNQSYTQTFEDQKYQVWARMLEEDEWQAVQETLDNLPEETNSQLGDKLRTQFWFALLYFLGLRIHEVAGNTWRAFQFREGKWWFFVKGKGGKLGHIPVHEKLLTLAKLYRIYLNKTPLPQFDEQEPLLLSLNHKSIQSRQLYNVVKKVGFLASLKFKAEPAKASKLKRLSPHWLRHLCASHQDRAGIPALIIKENLRHRSSQTTQIYLHAEEKLRHELMQKMSLKIDLKPIIRKTVTCQTVVQIRLTKGPVHKGLGFKKLVEVLEGEVFEPYQWQPYQFEKTEKIEAIETSVIPIQIIQFAYVFDGLDPSHIEGLKKAICLEASTRLFECAFEWKEVS